MKINQFSQQGKRSNNEDSLGITKGLLTVCDGMGGHNFGERASAFVKEAMTQAFVSPRPLNKMDIQQQLTKVQTDLNQLLETEPELEKMGTTFTGVFITPDVWYAAHIGDSRIYLFRPSEKKLWHTWDHSLVGELMRTKEITVEAGRFHPMSNRIAKAIIAKRDGKTANASIVKIDQLKKGDIFLLCSDGVVEGWGDLELVKLFSDKSLSFDQKCQKLSEQCNEKSKDNNTAIIAEIEEGDVINFGRNDELEWTTFAEVEADYNKYLKDNSDDEEEESKPAPNAAPNPPVYFDQTPAEEPAPSHHTTKTNGINRGILIAVIAVAIVALCFLFKPSPKPPVVIDHDTEDFKACSQVDDYREYLADYGRNAKHYDEAKQIIDKYVADSIAEVLRLQAEARIAELMGEDISESIEEVEVDDDTLKQQKEDEAFDKCTTIKACDKYLKDYPDGRYVDQEKAKKTELERKQAEAKEDEAFKNCTTIAACNKYLEEYPEGRFVTEVSRKKAELEEKAREEAEAEAKGKENKEVKVEEEVILEQSTESEEKAEQKTENKGTAVSITKTESIEVDHLTFVMKKQDGETSGSISDKPVSQALWLTQMGGDPKYDEWGDNSDKENTPAVVEDENDIEKFVTRLNGKTKKKFSYQLDDATGGFHLILND